jgi:hypothetical protein
VGNTLVTLNIGSAGIEDRVGLDSLLFAVGERRDTIVLFLLHGKDGSFVGSIVTGHDLISAFFLEGTPVVGTGTLLSLGFGFDKPRSGVLVLLHCGREEVSLVVS